MGYEGQIQIVISFIMVTIYVVTIMTIYYFLAKKMPKWSVNLKHPVKAILVTITSLSIIEIIKILLFIYVHSIDIFMLLKIGSFITPLIVLLMYSEKIQSKKQLALPIIVTIILPILLVVSLLSFIGISS